MNLLSNGDRQANWMTGPDGNQTPLDWEVVYLPNNSTMFWAEKAYGNGQGIMLARVERQPEIVFKLATQLPPDEQAGQSRALLLGPVLKQVYKSFHGPSCTRHVNRVLGLTPGRKVRLSCYILPDTQDVPRGPAGHLEDDHCHAQVELVCNGYSSPVPVHRTYAEMKDRRDWPGNSRVWNLFEISAFVPPSGEMTIIQKTQQNWPNDPTGVAFFFGPCSLDYVDEPAPTPAPAPQPGTVDAVASSLEQIAVDFNSMTNAINAVNALSQQILTDITNARQMIAKIKSEIAPPG